MADIVEVTVAGKLYKVQLSGPPPPMIAVADLEKALETNREHIRQATIAIKATTKQELIDRALPKKLNYVGPTHLAIMAHLNINMLIPIINIKGGHATFEKPETFPVEQRINGIHNVAKKQVLMENYRVPFPMEKFSVTLLLSVFIIFTLLVV
jgi:cell division protein ZapA (FtsZ GTPase activity inhibitor)